MNDYIEVRIDMNPFPGEDATDYMAAILGDIGFESFVPDNEGLTAYIQSGLWNESEFNNAIEDFPFDTTLSAKSVLVEGKDWNEEWEKNYFKPIVVGGKCVVHSTFHTDVPAMEYDIVIDPKMAFGTGHHATTSLVLSELLDMDLIGKTLIDMGTGTGILAIAASMRGAKDVYAIEIDSFAYNNAIENVKLNGCPEIKLFNGDASALRNLNCMADVFVANINRNVITNDIAQYSESLSSNGTMLLSGFYESDIPIVIESAKACGLSYEGYMTKDNWACLKLKKI